MLWYYHCLLWEFFLIHSFFLIFPCAGGTTPVGGDAKDTVYFKDMVVIEITSLNHDGGNGLEKVAKESGELTTGLVRRGKDVCDSVFPGA